MITSKYLKPLYNDFYNHLKKHGQEKTIQYYLNNSKMNKEHKKQSINPANIYTVYRMKASDNLMIIFKYTFYMCATVDTGEPYIAFSCNTKNYQIYPNGLAKFHIPGQGKETNNFKRKIYFPNEYDHSTLMPNSDTWFNELIKIQAEELDTESVELGKIYNTIQ